MPQRSKVNLTKLQRLIDKAADANAVAYYATDDLYNYCQKIYGCIPGDIDADQIIDAVLGGCGASGGMPAELFDSIMRGVDD